MRDAGKAAQRGNVNESCVDMFVMFLLNFEQKSIKYISFLFPFHPSIYTYTFSVA